MSASFNQLSFSKAELELDSFIIKIYVPSFTHQNDHAVESPPHQWNMRESWSPDEPVENSFPGCLKKSDAEAYLCASRESMLCAVLLEPEKWEYRPMFHSALLISVCPPYVVVFSDPVTFGLQLSTLFREKLVHAFSKVSTQEMTGLHSGEKTDRLVWVMQKVSTLWSPPHEKQIFIAFLKTLNVFKNITECKINYSCCW